MESLDVEEQCEPAPVRVAGVQEAVGRVLAKRQRFLVKPTLHVERAVLEDDADKHKEHQNGGKSLELAGIGRAQNLTDAVTMEEHRSFLRNGFHLLGGLWYNFHSMNLRFSMFCFTP